MSSQRPLLLFVIAIGLGGCAADPAFEQPLGGSVRQMISTQTYEPEKPAGATEPSPMLYEGSQSERSIELYRTRNSIRPETRTLQVVK